MGTILLRDHFGFFHLRFPQIELTQLVKSYDGPITTIQSDKAIEVNIRGMIANMPRVIQFRFDDLQIIKDSYIQELESQFQLLIDNIVLLSLKKSMLSEGKKQQAQNKLESIKKRQLRQIKTKIRRFPGIDNTKFNSFDEMIEFLKSHFAELESKINPDAKELYNQIRDVSLIC